MKTFINKFTLLVIASFSLISCSNNDSNQTIPTAQSFSNLQTIALNSVLKISQ
jgi:uncharacterized protein YcfL